MLGAAGQWGRCLTRLRRKYPAEPPHVTHAAALPPGTPHTPRPICSPPAAKSICCNKLNFACGVRVDNGQPRCAVCPQVCIFTCSPVSTGAPAPHPFGFGLGCGAWPQPQARLALPEWPRGAPGQQPCRALSSAAPSAAPLPHRYRPNEGGCGGWAPRADRRPRPTPHPPLLPPLFPGLCVRQEGRLLPVRQAGGQAGVQH